MATMLETAKKFFEACETGKGWDGCKAFCTADATFSSQATPVPEIHPKVVWAKFQAMAEGARLATRQLWG